LFSQQILEWQIFFVTVAGASATLMGLIFLSLSLKLDVLRQMKDKKIRQVAWQTFANFFFLIMFALVFLVPQQTLLGLALPLLIICAVAIGITVSQALREVWNVCFVCNSRIGAFFNSLSRNDCGNGNLAVGDTSKSRLAFAYRDYLAGHSREKCMESPGQRERITSLSSKNLYSDFFKPWISSLHCLYSLSMKESLLKTSLPLSATPSA
jgi:hypothetical protein